ncbi:unnamed protein product [Hyaloperonospora brassicae]|uniref:Essential protein Yae1 N-terminal domain-containing protein n=1 Tax=Hyaloperonospora brassicae TaxID=162125 RepID=A0AAV0TF35_HYABA|nr:unnamed protein product [Hyaloperonospora brassicae]
MAVPLDSRSDSDDGFQDFLSDNSGDQEALLTQESAALERRMKTMGIRDGLELGKEITLQEGFDAGYAQGAARSFRVGTLRGALETAVRCGLTNDEAMLTEARACISQLKTLERDSKLHDGTSEDSAELVVLTQAEDLLTSIGVDVTTL